MPITRIIRTHTPTTTHLMLVRCVIYAFPSRFLQFESRSDIERLAERINPKMRVLFNFMGAPAPLGRLEDKIGLCCSFCGDRDFFLHGRTDAGMPGHEGIFARRYIRE